MAESIKKNASNILVVLIIYLVSYGLVEFISLNFKSGSNVGYAFASFIFLPHGVRVLSTLIFGTFRSFIYLFISGSLIIFLPSIGNDLPISVQLLQCLVGALCAPLAFKLLEFAIGTPSVYFRKISINSWRILILAIILSSLINAIGQTTVVELVDPRAISMSLVLAYLTGDIIGAVALIMMSLFVLKQLKI